MRGGRRGGGGGGGEGGGGGRGEGREEGEEEGMYSTHTKVFFKHVLSQMKYKSVLVRQYKSATFYFAFLLPKK